MDSCNDDSVIQVLLILSGKISRNPKICALMIIEYLVKIEEILFIVLIGLKYWHRFQSDRIFKYIAPQQSAFKGIIININILWIYYIGSMPNA